MNEIMTKTDLTLENDGFAVISGNPPRENHARFPNVWSAKRWYTAEL